MTSARRVSNMNVGWGGGGGGDHSISTCRILPKDRKKICKIDDYICVFHYIPANLQLFSFSLLFSRVPRVLILYNGTQCVLKDNQLAWYLYCSQDSRPECLSSD